MASFVEIYDKVNVLERFSPPKHQLLKWIGNKQKFASSITSYFPINFNRYIEPFLGSGAILATVWPKDGIGSDTFKPLIEIWKELKANPTSVVDWYAERRNMIGRHSKEEVYTIVRNSYNSNPNGADFLYLSRSCYGGVVRFRKADGYMSTPCGVHDPIDVTSFQKRVDTWHARVKNSKFIHQDYKKAFKQSKKGDLIYCDPPYSYSQGILYGAQSFRLEELLEEIGKAKKRGVYIALSIDGNKKSGDFICDLPIPKKLFEREIFIELGRSMLKRFQMEGQSLEKEHVSDRLLLTY
jgi:DNA adenine methylase